MIFFLPCICQELSVYSFAEYPVDYTLWCIPEIFLENCEFLQKIYEIPLLQLRIMEFLRFAGFSNNPNQAGGGGQIACRKSKWLFFCNRMSDWPQTKLYFQVCPLSWGLSKKWSIWTLERPWRGLYRQGSPKISLLGEKLQGPFGGQWRSMRVPGTLVKYNNDQLP